LPRAAPAGTLDTMEARKKPLGKNDTMNRPGQAEKVGRKLLLGAMAVGVAFEVLRQVFAMAATGELLTDDLSLILLQAMGVLFRLAVLIFLFIETSEGRTWARWALGGLYLASAVYFYYPLVGLPFSDIDLFDAATVAVFLALGVLLLAAAPIRDYQAQKRAKKGR